MFLTGGRYNLKRMSFKLFLVVTVQFSMFSSHVFAQESTYTLSDVIKLAQKQSPDALAIYNKFRESYWQYKYFKADYLPSIAANIVIPEINRSVQQINVGGTPTFVSQNYVNSSFTGILNQNIGLTGGSFYVNSGLKRLDVLKDSTSDRSFLSTPIIVGLNQPIFAYNDLRWNRKIEPVIYEESQREYLSDIEEVSIKAINLFFDVLAAQTAYNISETNQKNNDTLYKISKGRYELGRIAENEVLQMELNKLNADLSLKQASINKDAAMFKLVSFLSLSEGSRLDLVLPTDLDTSTVDEKKAWELAQKYGQDPLTIQRQTLQAERDLKQAKGNAGISSNLFVQYGLNKNAVDLNKVYQDPETQEQLRFGIQIPIIDWGKSHGQIETAKARQNLSTARITQQKTDFEQNVYLRASRYNLQASQVQISKQAEEIGRRRYFIAKQRFLIGKIGIADLNIAQLDKDASGKAFIESLRDYWVAKYRLNQIALYNFSTGQPLKLPAN